ncbi:uncharacterized protein LOC128728419 [Anopheles nili]|uniref:uncharacterized protein LOC128728419 n=1 Tax=Anopheles nili TaxID=185578 RepID=UPI00237AF507|nr:uncharacterized protein LOC128728419 [Anopheles nili]
MFQYFSLLQMTNRPGYFSYGIGDTISSRQQALVNNQFSSDVTFLVGPEKKRIYAHKIFLTLASEYFYVMFHGNFVEAKKDEVVLEDVDPDVFLVILRYIYSRNVEITLDNARNIFDYAQKYMLPELIEQLGQFLVSRVDSSSVLRIFKDNSHYDYSEVNEACLFIIQDNPVFYFNHEDFTTIDMGRLSKILRLNKINCTIDQLQNALEIWEAANIDSDVSELRMHLKGSDRWYNCDKLVIFGTQEIVNGSEDTEQKFELISKKPVSIYGLGVYIMSKVDVISIQLKIFDENEEISSNVFEYINKSTYNMHAVDFFFEEIVLHPHILYCISIEPSSPLKKVMFKKTEMFHEKIKLKFWNRMFFMNTATAHIYCKENVGFDAREEETESTSAITNRIL